MKYEITDIAHPYNPKLRRIPYTDTKTVVENTGRRPMLKSVGGEDAA